VGYIAQPFHLLAYNMKDRYSSVTNQITAFVTTRISLYKVWRYKYMGNLSIGFTSA